MRELPDIITDIDQARTDLDELKLRQFVGTTSLIISENTSNNTWDVNQTISNGTRVKFWFLADHQVGPFAAFRATTLIDNVPWELADNNKFYESYVPEPSAMGFTADSDFERLAVAVYVCSVVGSFNLKMKMRVLANDTGTIGVVVLP